MRGQEPDDLKVLISFLSNIPRNIDNMLKFLRTLNSQPSLNALFFKLLKDAGGVKDQKSQRRFDRRNLKELEGLLVNLKTACEAILASLEQ